MPGKLDIKKHSPSILNIFSNLFKSKDVFIFSVAKVAGVNQADIPPDAEIDPQLMEALANNELVPEDIEIVRDEVSGRSFIKSRNRKIEEAMGGVEKGHLYKPATKSKSYILK